ncbi:MAG: septum formation protein Maf [Hyphomicrobiales bacterium]|nr:MAG: septum formation protein Maf [Hyphomicrobiales bacterium]
MNSPELDYGEFQNEALVLASKSPIRAALLRNAGLKIITCAANIDERAVEAALGRDVDPEDVALVLAEAKALDVANAYPDTLIIGADQTLSCDAEIFHKAGDENELRKNLLALSGRTHALNAAIVLVKNGETLWRYNAQAHLTMRTLSPQFIGRYIAQTLPDSLQSVGGYQLEGLGAQLFEKIEGDYFTILGLPLLPLLARLRQDDIIIS